MMSDDALSAELAGRGAVVSGAVGAAVCAVAVAGAVASGVCPKPNRWK